MLELLDKNNPNFNDLYKLFTRYNEYNQHKAYNKDLGKELMPIAWYPLKQWDWRMPVDENKEIENFWNNESGSKWYIKD